MVVGICHSDNDVECLSLLGVRDTTRNDIILIECGMPSLDDLIRKKAANFMKKQFLGDPDEDKPLLKIFKLCELNRTKGYRYIEDLLTVNIGRVPTLIEKFQNEEGSKAVTYKLINPNLTVHDVYKRDGYVNERERVVFTRLRLSSHNLKIETGRWSRTRRENRLCDCGPEIQDETHILFDCPKTDEARAQFNVNRELYPDVGNLMDSFNSSDLIRFVKYCMDKFD